MYRRKDGSYAGQAYGFTPSGARKRITVYGKTRKAARMKLAGILESERKGIPAPDGAMTLSEYLDGWLENVIMPRRRPSTYGQYAWITEKFLKPGLGAWQLRSLTVQNVQAFLDRASADGHSAHRVRLIRNVLRGALTRAMRDERVVRNVAQLVEVPRYAPREAKPWTPDEAKVFLAETRDHRFHAAYVLLIMFGLRRGEVLGLQWQDINFKTNVLSIRGQLVRADGALRLGPVKTRAGNRDLPLSWNLRRVLMERRELVKDDLGEYPTDGLVFGSTTGKPQDPDAFYATFRRAVRDAGLRPTRVHDLRHTAATILKDLGVPPRDAQLILGHADIRTTMAVYQHDTMDSRAETMRRVDDLYYPDKEDVTDLVAEPVIVDGSRA